jgi:outer membrane protein OmpA-like peptidoglycan-associated protein
VVALIPSLEVPMIVLKTSRCVALFAVVAALALGGCRRPGSGGMTDINGPTTFGSGDIALPDRFEGGTLVSDAAFANVQFAYDSFQVATTEIPKVQAVADYMKRNHATRLVAEGHCDERGSREYNLSLGEHRALAVRAHLVGLGIDGLRIQTRSFGEEMPLDPGHTENAWWMNRRVEFKIYR